MKTALFAAAISLVVVAAAPAAADTDGLSGATVGAGVSKRAEERRARFAELCRAEPEQCRAIEARRAHCRADPQRCRAERRARFEERFRRADADGDGALTRAEAEGGMPRLARRFDALDADHDGRVTLEEVEAARKARSDPGKPRS
jgi:hypothetical protein